MRDEYTERTRRLIGDAAQAALCRSRVALFGVGGVGGYVLEALCRAGIGEFIIIDGDTVSASNLNRQLLATTENIGELKTDAARRRVLAINPDARVTAVPRFYLPDTADGINPLLSGADYIVDAIDNVTAKLMLAGFAQEHEIPIISSMGTGNKLRPSGFYVTDIYKTQGDPLARAMRRCCRERGITSLKVVISDELPHTARDNTNSGINGDNSAENNKRTPASISFVPAAAGLVIAGEVISALTRGYAG